MSRKSLELLQKRTICCPKLGPWIYLLLCQHTFSRNFHLICYSQLILNRHIITLDEDKLLAQFWLHTHFGQENAFWKKNNSKSKAKSLI